MKKIALVIAIIFLIVSCGDKEQKQKKVVGEIQTQTQTETEGCAPKKYQLCDSTRNYFSIKDGKVRVKLNIPVTSDSLKLDTIINISTDSINAVLVHLKGNAVCTPPAPITKFISIDTIVNDLTQYRTRIQKHNKLLVYIYNNQNRSGSTNITGLKDYQSALAKIKRESYCPTGVATDYDKQPKEQDGDVIGGNQ